MRSLQDSAKRCIIGHVGIRNLKQLVVQTLPLLLAKDILFLEAEDFSGQADAPGGDKSVKSFKVTCTLDGQDYMAVRAAPEISVVHDEFWRWVLLSHANVMSVLALVLDDSRTVFFIVDLPDGCLRNLYDLLSRESLCIPEYFMWKVLRDLASALEFLNSQKLVIGRFNLGNFYVDVQGRLVMANKLLVDPWEDHLFCPNTVQWHLLDECPKVMPSTGAGTSTDPMMCLGFVLAELACLAFRGNKWELDKLEVTFNDIVGGSPLPLLGNHRATPPRGQCTYSSELYKLLGKLHLVEPPSSAHVREQAERMMKNEAIKHSFV